MTGLEWVFKMLGLPPRYLFFAVMVGLFYLFIVPTDWLPESITTESASKWVTIGTIVVTLLWLVSLWPEWRASRRAKQSRERQRTDLVDYMESLSPRELLYLVYVVRYKQTTIIGPPADPALDALLGRGILQPASRSALALTTVVSPVARELLLPIPQIVSVLSVLDDPGIQRAADDLHEEMGRRVSKAREFFNIG